MTAASQGGNEEWSERSSASAGFSLRRFIIAVIGLLIVWIALTGSLARGELVLGALVAIGVALISTPHLALIDDLRLTPLLPLHFLRFLGDFLLALILANFDVARRVLSPRVNVNPQIVEVKTALQSDLGRYWLANAITLTPGTLTTDVSADTLSVHWIDVTPGADIETATQRIAARFEKSLARIVK